MWHLTGVGLGSSFRSSISRSSRRLDHSWRINNENNFLEKLPAAAMCFSQLLGSYPWKVKIEWSKLKRNTMMLQEMSVPASTPLQSSVPLSCAPSPWSVPPGAAASPSPTWSAFPPSALPASPAFWIRKMLNYTENAAIFPHIYLIYIVTRIYVGTPILVLGVKIQSKYLTKIDNNEVRSELYTLLLWQSVRPCVLTVSSFNAHRSSMHFFVINSYLMFFAPHLFISASISSGVCLILTGFGGGWGLDGCCGLTCCILGGCCTAFVLK